MFSNVSSSPERFIISVESDAISDGALCVGSVNEIGESCVESSPRSRSKAKAVLWLKEALQELGSAVSEEGKAGHMIDNCFQVALPPLHKLCVALVRDTRNSSSILNTMSFNKILRNICAVRSEYVMKICKPVLQKLMAHDRNRAVFNHPVDPEELGIPNYRIVIKHPMDLGTVMSNLRGGQYYTAKACFADMELVFQNAMLFNPLPHEVHKMAKDLMAVLHDEIAQAEEKCLKENEKKSNHSCTLCSGSTCQLCGEKCLKFEPPSLNCQQCGTRVKKNANFFVCADGSALWCQKCYIALPPVIAPAAPRQLHSVDSAQDMTTCDSTADLTMTVTNDNTAQLDDEQEPEQSEPQQAMDLIDLTASTEPSNALSTSDETDSIHHAFSPTPGNNHYAHSSTSCGSGEPLLKRQLLRRKADEEVAEPWVACDSCGNWYHQICALYSKLGDNNGNTGNKAKFCCPYCVVLVGCQQIGVDLNSCLANVNLNTHNSNSIRNNSTAVSHYNPYKEVSLHTANTSPECSKIAMESADHVHIVHTPSHITNESEMEVLEVPKDFTETAESVERLKSQLAVKFNNDNLFQNILEYSSPMSSPCDIVEKKECEKTKYTNIGTNDMIVEMEINEGDNIDDFTMTVSNTTGTVTTTRRYIDNTVHTSINITSSSCVSTGSLSEGEMLVRSCESDYESITSRGVEGSDEFLEDVMQVDDGIAHSASTPAMWADTKNFTTNNNTNHNTDNIITSNTNTIHTNTTNATTAPSTPAPASPSRTLLDPHWKWRAASLPHTQLGDFLQQLVVDLLHTNGHHDAAARITIRMTSNHDRALEVPLSIVENMIAPSGNVIPGCMGYKQKCILLFQEIDGIDVCLFSLYVHEFDAQCPSPNTSTVYIAYLDSVDYFRPIAARTMVYQEIVAGYLKWSQMRGFKQAHIWSCPPHRGDNFIFNAHPVHQKYPSRERLNHWYKSILQRCTKSGVIAETGNLWSQYFSKYVRRDVMPVARQAAKNSFVGSGKAVKKTNAKAKKKNIPAIAASTAVAAGTDGVDGNSSVGVAEVKVEPVVVDLTSSTTNNAVTSVTNSASDAPVCPPIFDGDYWVQQYVYLVRLHTQKLKQPSTQAQRLHNSVRKFRELLKRLMLREESGPFLHPVDHIALDIPNYALIVKQPMDFNTIKEKLGAGEYQTALHFVNDVRLVFMNAKLFNPEEHVVYQSAESLSARFEKGLLLALSELQEVYGNGLLRAPIPAASSGPGTLSRGASAADLRDDANNNVEQQLEQIVLSNKLIAVSNLGASASATAATATSTNDLSQTTHANYGIGGEVEIVSSVHHGMMRSAYASNTIVPRFGPKDLAFDCSSYTSSTSGSGSSDGSHGEGSALDNDASTFALPLPLPGPALAPSPSVLCRTPLATNHKCTTVSRSGSICEEQDLVTSNAVSSQQSAPGSGRRSRSQSISVTPVLTQSKHLANATPTSTARAHTPLRAQHQQYQQQHLQQSEPHSAAVPTVTTTNTPVVPVELLSDTEGLLDCDMDLSLEAASERQLQHVVSQDFARAGPRSALASHTQGGEVLLDDDLCKKKKLEWAYFYSTTAADTTVTAATADTTIVDSVVGHSPESEVKRRRVSMDARMDIHHVPAESTESAGQELSAVEMKQEMELTMTAAVSSTTTTSCESGSNSGGVHANTVSASDAALLTSALRTVEFRADVLNRSHRPVPFSSPALGSQNTMTIVAELSKRMQRQYDDLFVIKLAPPDLQQQQQHHHQASAGESSTTAGNQTSSTATASAASSKKPRGRVALCVKRTPAMHLHGGLKELSPTCRAMLQQLRADTSDPDPVLHSPATDSRHTFLELCQFRHYQFDSLRRAKHSSLMLLYHLQHPLSKSCRPCCAHCDEPIHTLRWHCDACPDFDLCGTCYAADQDLAKQENNDARHGHQCGESATHVPAAPVEPQVSPRRRSVSRSTSTTLTHSGLANDAGNGAAAQSSKRKAHAHPLTPYRVSLF